MADALPRFRYHPDPVATGSVEPSESACRACGRQRGLIYAGPVYAVERLRGAFCPWCIADGLAASLFDAEFTDVGWGVPDDVPASVTDEISRRTPGFSSWQQDHWLYHCGDGCAFLGAIGWEEIRELPEAVAAVRDENRELGWREDDANAYMRSLDRNGQPTAYLFRCLHCSRHLAYSDYT